VELVLHTFNEAVLNEHRTVAVCWPPVIAVEDASVLRRAGFDHQKASDSWRRDVEHDSGDHL